MCSVSPHVTLAIAQPKYSVELCGLDGGVYVSSIVVEYITLARASMGHFPQTTRITTIRTVHSVRSSPPAFPSRPRGFNTEKA
jgi:hypothetical protein